MKTTYRTISSEGARVLRKHIQATNLPLLRRLVAAERRAKHRERVAICNHQCEIRRWSADCKRLADDIRAAHARGEINVSLPLVDALAATVGEIK